MNEHEDRARQRKATNLWGLLRSSCPDFAPTDEQINAIAVANGINPPSAATCDRVRELAAVSARVDARPVEDFLS